MELKKIIEDIKLCIDSDLVLNKIQSDLGLVFKNGKCKCFMHSPSADTVMSYDKKLKKLKCFSCGQSYDLFNHYQQYYNLGFLESVKAIVKDFNLNIDININDTDRKPVKAPTVHEKYSQGVLNYCNKRSISKETIDYAGIKDIRGDVVFEYKNELGEHITNKYRYTKKGASPKTRFEAETNINTLFNMDKINVSEPLVITEGEFDTLAVIESGYKNAVSIPSGVNSANKWITTNWTWIEQFDEIILWFDNDEAGIKGVRDVFNRLPNKSVKIVRCDLANDINEVLHKFGKMEVLNQIKKASTPLLDGVVTLDMIEDYDPFEAEKIKLGIKEIDDSILGLMFGSLNVFSGRNGGGKSTMLNQIYIGESIRQGYKVFLFTGELPSKNLKNMLLRTMANECDLEEANTKEGARYTRIKKESRLKIVSKLKDMFFLYENEEDYTINGVLAKMEVLAKRYGVRVFIIDNLMVTEDEDKDEYKSQSNIVKKLKSFAKKYDAMVHLVAHPRKSQNQEIRKDDVAGSANITNLADYVTTIERVFEDDEITDKHTLLKIIKNRHTGNNVGKMLQFNDRRKRFYNEHNPHEQLEVDYLAQEFEQIEGDWE